MHYAQKVDFGLLVIAIARILLRDQTPDVHTSHPRQRVYGRTDSVSTETTCVLSPYLYEAEFTIKYFQTLLSGLNHSQTDGQEKRTMVQIPMTSAPDLEYSGDKIHSTSMTCCSKSHVFYKCEGVCQDDLLCYE
jgi:hypothetical protein